MLDIFDRQRNSVMDRHLLVASMARLRDDIFDIYVTKQTGLTYPTSIR